MNRPIFLTRTQRVLRLVPQLLALVVVLGLFIGTGLLIAYEVSK